jgi:hypothetical protein
VCVCVCVEIVLFCSTRCADFARVCPCQSHFIEVCCLQEGAGMMLVAPDESVVGRVMGFCRLVLQMAGEYVIVSVEQPTGKPILVTAYNPRKAINRILHVTPELVRCETLMVHVLRSCRIVFAHS